MEQQRRRIRGPAEQYTELLAELTDRIDSDTDHVLTPNTGRVYE